MQIETEAMMATPASVVVGLLVGLVVTALGRSMLGRRDGDMLGSRNLYSTLAQRDVWPVAVALSLFLVIGATVETVPGAIRIGAYTALFLLIAIIDVEQRRVPNILVGCGALFAVAVSLVSQRPPLHAALLGGSVAFVAFALIAILTRGSLGMGDVKLAAVIGLATGFPGVGRALVLGVLLGGVASAGLLFLGRAEPRSYIPYAPFLVAGAWIQLWLAIA